MKDCLFCKIANKELESTIVYEDNEFLGMKDINPISPVHVLIIPKKHIESIDKMEEGDIQTIGRLFLIAKKIGREQNVAEDGYRLVINVGKAGHIDHLHLHLLGGKKLQWP